MKTGVQLLFTILILACFLSCEKGNPLEVNTPFEPIPKKVNTSLYSKIIQSPLKTETNFDGFNNVFLGSWHVVEVITLNPLGQWIYMDYSTMGLEYSFFEDCRYYNPGEMLCRFESTHEPDPSGYFEIKIEDNHQKLFLQSDLSDLSLDESYWGDIYHWPAAPDLMIVHKPEAPFWIIMEKIIVE